MLAWIPPVRPCDLILGQYGQSEDGSKPAYTDDETVPSSSATPTFAMATLYVRNERWDGVPFILRCGKALNEQKAEIRIQFNDVPGALFSQSSSMFSDLELPECGKISGPTASGTDSPQFYAPPPPVGTDELARNELVLRVQPNEAVYMKLMVKRPGHGMHPMLSDLDLSYASRYSQLRIPDAYESLILDVLRGEQANFVRDDELTQAWRIFTPVLHEIERNHTMPLSYPAGSRGPLAADEKLIQLGYRRSHHNSEQYSWPKQPVE